MVVRLTVENRSLGARAGELWDLPNAEAALLIERGDAVPVSTEEALHGAKETR